MFDNELLALQATISEEMTKELKTKDPSIQKVHYSLGPEAKNMSHQELKAYLHEVEEAIAKERAEWNAKSEQEKLLVYLNQTVTALEQIIKLTQMSFADFGNLEKLQKMRGDIFCIAEGATFCLNDTETFSLRNIDA